MSPMNLRALRAKTVAAAALRTRARQGIRFESLALALGHSPNRAQLAEFLVIAAAATVGRIPLGPRHPGTFAAHQKATSSRPLPAVDSLDSDLVARPRSHIAGNGVVLRPNRRGAPHRQAPDSSSLAPHYK